MHCYFFSVNAANVLLRVWSTDGFKSRGDESESHLQQNKWFEKFANVLAEFTL